MKSLNSKRKSGTIWKEKRPAYRTKPWYVQFPKGKEGFKTKSEATLWSAALKQNLITESF